MVDFFATGLSKEEEESLRIAMHHRLGFLRKPLSYPPAVEFDVDSRDVDLLQKLLRFSMKKYKETYLQKMMISRESQDKIIQYQSDQSSEQKKMEHMKTSLDSKNTLIDGLEKVNAELGEDIKLEKEDHDRTKAMLEVLQKRNEVLTKVNAELRLMQESDKKELDELQDRYTKSKEELNSQRSRLLDLTLDLEAKYTSALELCHGLPPQKTHKKTSTNRKTSPKAATKSKSPKVTRANSRKRKVKNDASKSNSGGDGQKKKKRAVNKKTTREELGN